MAFYKVRIKRESNAPKAFNVVASKPQEAILAAALELREEGITDANGIEVICRVKSLRG